MPSTVSFVLIIHIFQVPGDVEITRAACIWSEFNHTAVQSTSILHE